MEDFHLSLEYIYSFVLFLIFEEVAVPCMFVFKEKLMFNSF